MTTTITTIGSPSGTILYDPNNTAINNPNVLMAEFADNSQQKITAKDIRDLTATFMWHTQQGPVNGLPTNPHNVTAAETGAIATINGISGNENGNLVLSSSNGISITPGSHTINISQTPQAQSNYAETDTSAVDYIKNKPTIPDAQVNSDWNATSGVAKILNKPDINSAATDTNISSDGSGNLTAVSFVGDGAGLTGLSSSGTPVGASGQVQFNNNGAFGGAAINVVPSLMGVEIGQDALAFNYGQVGLSNGMFSIAGDNQASFYLVRGGACPTILYLDGATQEIVIPNGAYWAFTWTLVANNAFSHGTGYINNNGGTLGFINLTEVAGGLLNRSLLFQDGGNGTLQLYFNNNGSTNVVMRLDTIELNLPGGGSSSSSSSSSVGYQLSGLAITDPGSYGDPTQGTFYPTGSENNGQPMYQNSAYAAWYLWFNSNGKWQVSQYYAQAGNYTTPPYALASTSYGDLSDPTYGNPYTGDGSILMGNGPLIEV